VPSYNVPGVSGQINFTPEVLAGIYLGEIKKWNDAKITSANPKLKLPDKDILVIHRSDGSGTTYCWTDYLSKVSEQWKSKVGKNTSVEWPTGVGAKGNDGVAGLLKQQEGSIGYMELIYAVKNHLPFGKVQNKSGEFVKADLAAEQAQGARPGAIVLFDAIGQHPFDQIVILAHGLARRFCGNPNAQTRLLLTLLKERAKFSDFAHK
jgi:phosphate transport system substrate-binding protein